MYGLEVVRVPTNKPSRRTDLGSYLFLTTAAKYDQLLYIVRSWDSHENCQTSTSYALSVKRVLLPTPKLESRAGRQQHARSGAQLCQHMA